MQNTNALARKHINKVLTEGTLIGSNTNCRSYPCHFEGQDCTWCYCPLYPCLYDKKGHYVTTGTGRRIWDCSSCSAIHTKENALTVLNILKKSAQRVEDITNGDIATAKRVIAPRG